MPGLHIRVKAARKLRIAAAPILREQSRAALRFRMRRIRFKRGHEGRCREQVFHVALHQFDEHGVRRSFIQQRVIVREFRAVFHAPEICGKERQQGVAERIAEQVQ